MKATGLCRNALFLAGPGLHTEKEKIVTCKRIAKFNVAFCIAGSLLLGSVAYAADGSPAEEASSTRTQSTAAKQEADKNLSSDAIEQLKHQIAEQQKQIDLLRKNLESQQRLLDSALTPAAQPSVAPENGGTNAGPSPFTKLGEVASRTPVIPTGNASAAVVAPRTLAQPPADAAGPLQIHLGNTYISPVGFMDMTAVSRSTNPGSGIGTNFGSIPYDHTQAAALTETRLSPQNSRIGFRVDTGFKGFNVLGYLEADFLGQVGAPPNGGIAVSSNSYPLRMRLYWVDVQKHNFEFLAGQSWSLATPNRKGVSPLPGDIFYSQDIDVNYQAGLVWGRIPQFRFAYHFGDKAALAVSLENSEPYTGGGNGGSGIVFPAAYPATNATSGNIVGGQINNGASVISSAALHPDIIVKLALDPTPKVHFELMGLEISNRIAFPAATATQPIYTTHANAGGGGAVNFSFLLGKGFRVVTNNFIGSGAGRYIFGQAPDFIVKADGTLDTVGAASTVTGIEATLGKTLYYGYYGGVYIDRNRSLDANGKSLIGYGAISNDGQNRSIQEITFGTNTTLAKDPRWGALNLMFQYSYLQRNPWLVTGTAPSDAHLSMGFVNFRYTLPGSAAPKMYK